MPTPEELRAELWQRNQQTMIAARAEFNASMAGSGSLRHQLEKDWDPLYQWLRERGQSDELEDESVR